jgi:glycerophosphoryl diester phosphodiesterase
MDIKKSTFCAHRGASGNFPENTMCAFNAALALGATWIETDLNLSSDEKLVIFHDANLGRTTSDSGALSLLTLNEIQSLDAGSWKDEAFSNEKVLSFQELLNWQDTHEVNINYELKCDAANPNKVVTILSKELRDRDPKKIIISSFSEKLLVASIKVIPSYRHALISERLPKNWKNKSRELNLNAWHLNADYLNLNQVRALHRERLKVRVYTVNNKTKYKKMNEWGVDMIMSDYPEKFLDF